MRTRTVRSGRRRGGRFGAALRLAAVNAAVFLALLLAAEAFVRVAAPGIVPAAADEALFSFAANADRTASYHLTPGASGDAYGAAVRVSPDGTWAYADADTAGAAVLLVGDSVTMGLGVAPDETFAGRLAHLPGVHVANPSVLGWAAADYRRAIEARLSDSLRAVVLVWCLNDLYPEGQPLPIAAAERAAAAAPTATLGQRTYQAVRVGAASQLAWLNRYSRLYRLVRTVATDASGRAFAFDRSLYTDQAHQPDRDRAFRQLRAIRDTLAAHHVPFTVVVVPEAPQVETGDTVPQDTLRARLASLGIRHVDLRPALSSGDFLTGDGTHLSPAGHAAVAAVLRPLIE